VLVADVDASYAQTAIRKLQPPRSVLSAFKAGGFRC